MNDTVVEFRWDGQTFIPLVAFFGVHPDGGIPASREKKRESYKNKAFDTIFASDYRRDFNRLKPKFATQRNREFGSQ